MQVGFIGLGMMGASMAANLQKAGHKLIVNDVRREAADNHIANGAKWAASPAELAKQCDVVFLSLPGPPEVEAVALGEGGLLGGLKRGAAVFDLSTNSPTLVRKIHGVYAEKGVSMMDAPVSGGPHGRALGADGHLGRRRQGDLRQIQAAARCHGRSGPLYRRDRRRARWPSSYTIARATHPDGAVRSVHHGRKGGVEPLALWEAVRGGAQGRRRTFDGLVDQFLVNKYEPAAFALKLAHKDMTLATQLGREIGVPMRVANTAMAEMTEALNRGWDKQRLALAHEAADRARGREDRGRQAEDRRGAGPRSAV